MKPKRRRLYIIGLALLCLGAATALVLTAFEDNIVFFYSPTELAERQDIGPGRMMRIGGLVADGTVVKNNATVSFTVTDLNNTVPVSYTGILPDLFREGQGVVVEGSLGPDGRFMATEVLAKHDENYMPKEVADALKASGQWQHAEEAPK
ncbi:MAG: cytochrome c maturation protein CcmE [Rhodospirillales bacterium]